MKPMTPNMNNELMSVLGGKIVVYAKNQEQYLQLPALRFVDGCVVTKWELSFIERLRILFKGRIFLELMTFNNPLQPIKLSTKYGYKI